MTNNGNISNGNISSDTYYCNDDFVPRCCRLDYPGIGPEHSYLSDIGRAEYYAVTDAEALEAFQQVSRLEGIIPALETSHAFAYLKVPQHPTVHTLSHACYLRSYTSLHCHTMSYTYIACRNP